MRIYTKTVTEWSEEKQAFIMTHCESEEYEGSVAWCGSKGGSPPPPDYTPMAKASEEGIAVSKELSEKQMAEAKRQYDLNYALGQPIVQAQLESMRAGLRQGEDYYNYMLSQQRPVEGALNVEALRDTSVRDAAERALLTGPEADIYAARRGDIEDQVGMALADTRRGSARNVNQLIRQGLRYGYSPQAMAARLLPYTQQGAVEAAAANQARRAGITQARGLMGQARDLRAQDEARGWAKKLDVAGLYRGLPGASQGAYGLATGAGSSALQSGMAPGQQYMQGLQQGTGTMMQGYGQRMQGLGSILNAQTSMYGAGLQAAATESAGMGQLVGSGIGAYAAFAAPSDRRLKSNIVKVGEFIDGINLYEFSYTDDPDARYRGVMADEVESVVPEAVIEGPYGYKMVNYDLLGIKMERV